MTVIRLWSSLTYFTVNAKLLGFEFEDTSLGRRLFLLFFINNDEKTCSS